MLKGKKKSTMTAKLKNIKRKKGQKTHYERRVNKSGYLEVRIKNKRKME